MGLTRRGVLSGAAGVTGAMATLNACGPANPAPIVAAPAPPLDPASWDSVRAQFALDPAYNHLASFVFASHPGPVRAAIDRFRLALDHNPVSALANEAENDQAVLAAAARHLDTRADQIAFTGSTTMGLGLLYTGLRLRSGDEVLTTEHDFYSTHESLRLRGQRDGVAVRRVKLFNDPATASVDEIVGNLRAAVTARTSVVAVTWVHSSTGVRLPIRQIA